MLPSAAHDLADVLTSEVGRCEPALPSGPVLVDPTAAELDDALVAAMRAAHERRATLVLAFIGHGGSDDDDFYLMAADSAVPDSRQAVLVGQRLKELLRRYSGLDGLLILIDACHSGLAVDAAGRDWLRTLRRGGRRLELLTATDEGPAYGACTSRTLTRLIRTGSPQLGERMHLAEVKAHLDEQCRSQVATHLAYDGSRDALVSDPTAWIALNPAWCSSPLADTSGPASVEHLTRYYEPTAAFADLRVLLDAGAGCVVVSGPPGSGKSATVAELAHPRTAAGVHAAVFLSGTDTVEQVAAELARQLRGQDLGFAAACDRYWDTLPSVWPKVDALDVHVLGPLRHLECPVRIIIDGIDTYDGETAERLVSGVLALADLDHVQVVVTGDKALRALPQGERIVLGSADEADLARYARRRDVDVEALLRLSNGVWRAATRLADGMRFAATLSAAESPGNGYGRRLQRAGWERDERVRAVLTVLVAAGPGPVVPIRLLSAASGVTEIAALRDLLYRLGDLVVRGRPGDDDEHVGLADPDIGQHLRDIGADEPAGHAMLADAIPDVPSAAAYAVAAQHRHLWACGRHTDAFASVEAHESPIPRENRARWVELAELADPGPLRRMARARAATWTAKSGEPDAALPVFHALIAESPTDDVATLSLRNNVAYWTGESGDWAAARHMTRALVADCRRLLGHEDPETLSARHLYALALAKLGHIDEGMQRFREVVDARDRVIGPDHIDTLRSRHNLLYWEAETAYPPPVAEKWSQLVADLAHSIGEDHPETLTARYHQALFDAKRGAVSSAMVEFHALLPQVERVLGPWHPDIRKITEQLVFWSPQG